MPNIRTYNAPNVGVGQLRPNDSGAAAVLGAARTTEAMADQQAGQRAGVARGQERAASASATALRDVVRGVSEVAGAAAYEVAQHQERQEGIKQEADKSTSMNNLTRSWNETRAKADLNDPNVAQQWNEDVFTKWAADFSDAYHTPRMKQAAAEFIGRMSEHFFTKQTSDMSAAAGEAAVLNVTTAGNRDADTLIKDPSSYDFIQEIARDRIENLKTDPHLSQEQRAHLDELGAKTFAENAQAAIHGMASVNPAAAKAALDSGFANDVLDASQRSQLYSYVDTVARMNIERDNAADMKQKRENVAIATGAANKILASHLRPDGTLAVGPDYFEGIKTGAGLQDSPDGLWRSMYEMGVAAMDREKKHVVITTDPDLFAKFSERAITPDTDPRKLTMMEINDANAKGLIDDTDTARLRTYLATEDPAKKAALAQFNDILNSYKLTIMPTNIGGIPVSPQEQQKWGRLQTDARDVFEDVWTKGTWRSAITAGSKDYIFNDISGYLKNGKGRLAEYRSNVQKGIPGTPPAVEGRVGEKPSADKIQPGESLEDFDKRTLGK